MKQFDLHVHTRISSCSVLRPGEILGYARALGLDGVCITDHGSMAISGQITEGVQDDGLCVVFGLEYETPDGDFLLFGPFENLKPGYPARDLLRLVEDRGGVAVAAHPFRQGRPLQEYVVQEGLCRIVERLNGRNTSAENRGAHAWQQQYDVHFCGGSDAHNLQELGRIVTVFEDTIQSRADLITALKSGRFYPQERIKRESAPADVLSSAL